MRRNLLPSVAFATIFLFSAVARSDQLSLKNGKRLDCIILSSDNSSYRIKYFDAKACKIKIAQLGAGDVVLASRDCGNNSRLLSTWEQSVKDNCPNTPPAEKADPASDLPDEPQHSGSTLVITNPDLPKHVPKAAGQQPPKTSDEAPPLTNCAKRRIALGKLTVDSWSWENLPYSTGLKVSKGVRVTGAVSNNSSFPASGVMIHVELRDFLNRPVGAGEAVLKPRTIFPGGTATFEVYLRDAECSTKQADLSYHFQ